MEYARTRLSRVSTSAALVAAVALTATAPASLAGPPPDSADAVARELTNPNNDIAKLTIKNQYRWYKGDLPNADEQSNYSMLFQPSFPFSLGTNESGDKAVFFLRPAIPVLVNQPYFDVERLDFRDTTDIGDIGFDVAYGVTKKTGMVLLGGLVGTLPTGTSDEATGAQLRLGPEAVLARLSKWGLVGIFPSHQWDVTGAGGTKAQRDSDFSTTQVQLFLIHTAGGGYTFGTQPILDYNWETENWTVPLQLYGTKTVKLGSTPVRFELELNYYVEQEDAFGPEWMLGFNITPVVHNFIEDAFRKK